MKPLPCSDPHVLLPDVCPAADPRCTGCARQVGMFAGLVRAIKRRCGLVRERPVGVVDLGSVLQRYVLLHVYGAARAGDDGGDHGCSMDPREWYLTIDQIIWADPGDWVGLGGGCDQRMPAVYLVAMLRHYMGYPERSEAVQCQMRTPQYRAGIMRVEAQLTMRACELGLDRVSKQPRSAVASP